MNELHDIIFVTDKYGRRNKTGDIEKLQYDSRKYVYYITIKFIFGISVSSLNQIRCRKLFSEHCVLELQ